MKKILFTLTMAIFGLGLFAAPVSQETAQKVAVNFYKHLVPSATDLSIANVATGTKDGLTTYYIFNFTAGGWVIVSADDAVTPILGHSRSNEGSFDNSNKHAQWWLDGYSKHIKYIADAKLSNKHTSLEWKNIQNNQFPATKNLTAVSPMLTTTWNQAAAYDKDCPGSGGDACGCVAVATGQVINYWKWPAQGVGVHTDWQSGTATSYTVNFAASTYTWPMANSISAASQPIDSFLYKIGVGVSMQYASLSGTGSGAQESDIPRCLIENFDFQPTAELQTMANFSSADWLTLLETELNEGRPVLYAGEEPADAGGHSFVFDGYETSPSVEFDVNWGWGGYDDGYFAVGALNADGDEFNLDNQCVVRVQKKSAAPMAYFTASTNIPSVGGSVTFTDLSTNSPTSWVWTFEGGSPSTYTGQTPPAITYSTAGKYLVALTVVNATGNDTKTVSKMITVGGTAPKWIAGDLSYPKATLYDNRMVTQICIPSANVAWATMMDAGAVTHYPNEVAVTTDGGSTWKVDTIAFTGSTKSYFIANVDALNGDTAYAAMAPLSEYGGTIAKTVNGGKTWSLLASEPSYTTSWLDGVHFFDSQNGVCYGDATAASSKKFIVYTTANGGGSWTAVTVPNADDLNSTVETGLNGDFCAIGDSIWFGTSEGRVYYSYNKGITGSWAVTAANSATPDSCEVTPVFRTGGVGFAVCLNSGTDLLEGLKTSTNAGTSYSAINPTGFYLKNPDLAYIPGTPSSWVDVSGGWGSGSALSDNTDCANFINIDTGSVYYTAVKFFSPSVGYAGGMVSNMCRGIYAWDPSIITSIRSSNATNNQINVYPNPTSSYVNVELKGITTKSTVNVYNLVGENIMSKTIDPTYDNLMQLDLSSCKAGIYLVTVDTGSKIITKRVMLVK
jgi:PKD repeat protein